jgi:hypothetical protein
MHTSDTAIPGRADANVTDFNAGQQAGKRRSLDRMNPLEAAPFTTT